MNKPRALSAVVVAVVAPLDVGITNGITSVAAHPTSATATLKCRNQTYTWAHGKKPSLNSKVGPRTRSVVVGGHTLTDGRIDAHYGPQVDAPVKANYVDITTEDPSGAKLSRLVAVTIYPVKGKAKHYTIGATPHNITKYDLQKDRGEVDVPTDGHNSSGERTPKLKKVVVKARESCFTTQ